MTTMTNNSRVAAPTGLHPLDNPVWSALTTEQAPLAQGNELARRFPRDISPMCGMREVSDAAYGALAGLAEEGERIALALPGPPAPPAGWEIVRQAPLLQMLYTGGEPPAPRHPFQRLGAADAADMVALAAMTKPGPLEIRTHELGTYLGIRKNGALVAIAGERLRVPGFREISGVCTHPEHIGNGYATALMVELIRGMRARGEQPFLHVRQENTRAASLYRHLGFEDRVLLYVAVLRKLAG